MSDTEEQDSEVVAVNPGDSTSEDEPDERDEQATAQNYHPWPYLKEVFTFVSSKKGFLANELCPVQTQSQKASRFQELSVKFEKAHKGKQSKKQSVDVTLC